MDFKIDSDSGNFVSLILCDTKIALNVADKPNKFHGHQTIVLKSDNIKEDHQNLKDKGVSIELALADLGYGKTFIPVPRRPRVLPVDELVFWYGMFAPTGRGIRYHGLCPWGSIFRDLDGNKIEVIE